MINPPACTNLQCNFSGGGSADPNVGDTFTYRWDFGYNNPTTGAPATSTSSAPAHTFPAAGTYTVTLTTTDGWGKAASVTRVRHGHGSASASASAPGCVARSHAERPFPVHTGRGRCALVRAGSQPAVTSSGTRSAKTTTFSSNLFVSESRPPQVIRRRPAWSMLP